MAKYTITPWRSPADLLAVRSQLYTPETSPSSHPDQRRLAVDRIMAWKLRSNLPHAVESTALLIDAQLHHTLSPSTSLFSIRAVYSAAFTRFVTGFCDIGRSKERSLEPSSMLEIAKGIGMPVEFVALRHEATHEELPALGRLVKAAEDALGWLWSVYWSRLAEPESEEEAARSREVVRVEAKELLKGIRSKRREAMKARKPTGDAKDASTSAKACLGFIADDAQKLDALVSVLVQEKLLFPYKRELHDSLEGAYLMWDGVLKGISTEQRRFAMLLVKALLTALTEASDTRPDFDPEKEALFLWTSHILHSEEWGFQEGETGMLQEDAIRWCCLHPGYWTNRLGSEVLENMGEQYADVWIDVFKASQLGDAGKVEPRSRKPEGASVQRSTMQDLHDSTLLGQDHDAELGMWVQAAERPKVPIGQVR